MTGIIFNSVKAFVEQVGRRQVYRYAELDQMVCIYNGPSAGALAFKPKINSPHPQYPLMFVTDSNITAQAALIAEVSVTYAGIIQTSGAKSYITPPVTTESTVQGSRDFIQYVITQQYPAGITTYTVPQGPANAPYTEQQIYPAGYQYGTQSIAVRYIGNQCSIRYQSYPRPTKLNYSSLGLGRVGWTVISTTKGPVSVIGANISYDMCVAAIAKLTAGGATGVPPLYARNMGFDVEQRGAWYNVTEVYAPTF